MCADQRRVSVAGEHLRSAYEEIRLSMGHGERSLAEQAAGRALHHLDLAWRRLEQERALRRREPVGAIVERACGDARRAWGEVRRALAHWPSAHVAALRTAHDCLLAALNTLDEAEAPSAPPS